MTAPLIPLLGRQRLLFLLYPPPTCTGEQKGSDYEVKVPTLSHHPQEGDGARSEGFK